MQSINQEMPERCWAGASNRESIQARQMLHLLFKNRTLGIFTPHQ
jgi:hypothetical protein